MPSGVPRALSTACWSGWWSARITSPVGAWSWQHRPCSLLRDLCIRWKPLGQLGSGYRYSCPCGSSAVSKHLFSCLEPCALSGLLGGLLTASEGQVNLNSLDISCMLAWTSARGQPSALLWWGATLWGGGCSWGSLCTGFFPSSSLSTPALQSYATPPPDQEIRIL